LLGDNTVTTVADDELNFCELETAATLGEVDVGAADVEGCAEDIGAKPEVVGIGTGLLPVLVPALIDWDETGNDADACSLPPMILMSLTVGPD
jgi:hypothetical protein